MNAQGKEIITNVRDELEKNSDEKTKNSAFRFFKEEVRFYGVKTALVVRIAKQYFKEVKPLGKNQVFSLCEELLKSDYSEESWVAANWAYWMEDEFETADFKTFERWIGRYISNWASCDTLCNHAVGAFIEKYPEYLGGLKGWTQSPNRWMRRAAAVSLIIPAKNGKYLKDIFEIADMLLEDKDDLVQKGYGWMLKEASRRHQKEVFDYVVEHKATMPRTALRYAIEKMPQELRQKAMAKS
ncbi:MAG: DNA alkylation repair protein [Actinobacteria bacterium RBG_19FT_COMBO_54_7]|uniref:DNA alkylation repair protein n=1 Tax=Candidatus Solincola sediminis TaxID=1797199 RepID=A0A1F2WSW3_9ACTN|nr:MAG: DNA alkylation repair protein [Candidatus Solincola sediminis]OFW60208.1 MAG: DNA alkylation repair protein [Candidatus Solincola sediminis]OFW66953.1 MAG: DNA alkylation repair protein [Actinobacteria bacterium RBG_19FT_COMBO_54_7]